MRSVYLDYNATTPLAPQALEAMRPFLVEQFGNPSSSYALGRASHEAIEDARGRVAELLGASRGEIVFTSGGTEANNAALKGVFTDGPGPWQGHLIISALEHPAVVEPARYLERGGVRLTVVGCDRRGVIDPATVEAALTPLTRLVSIMLANNEVGTVQPLKEIAERCHRQGVLVHTDAAQAIGKIPVRVDDLSVDLLTLAGHKFYAPKGVGALFVRRGLVLEPLLHGAGHEAARRAGTENTPYLVALGVAAQLCGEQFPAVGSRMAALRDRLTELLREGIGPSVVVHGEGSPRLPNTLSVNFPGVAGDELLRHCPEVWASTGAACHAGLAKISATLAAMGCDEATARGTVRLSLGWHTTAAEIDRAAAALVAAWHQLAPAAEQATGH